MLIFALWPLCCTLICEIMRPYKIVRCSEYPHPHVSHPIRYFRVYSYGKVMDFENLVDVFRYMYKKRRPPKKFHLTIYIRQPLKDIKVRSYWYELDFNQLSIFDNEN